ncbi:hypothetical protein JWJ90_07495 [Desulfobulbus rhabdoformis]|nr:hypothetical protein [Desulfobulbus rhabdoformis]
MLWRGLDMLKFWLSHDLRECRRLGRMMRSWNRAVPLHLYNVDSLPEGHWFWRLLAPLFLSHFSGSTWHVRHDKAAAVEQWLIRHGVGQIEREFHPPCPVSTYIYDEQEQHMLSWMEALALVNPVSSPYVTESLLCCVARKLLPEVNASQAAILIERMKTDFAMSHLDEQGRLLWRGQPEAPETVKDGLRSQLNEHRHEILSQLESPLSLCCMHQLLEPILPLQEQVPLLERLVKRIEATRQYDLISLYWLPMIGPMFSVDEEVENRFSKVSIYQMLRPSVLDSLLTLFERNSQFHEALKLATYLQPLNPVQYGITISSLQERLGNFEEAYSQVERIALPAQVNAPQSVAVALVQRRAWMVVCARLEHKKAQGKEALATLASLLFSHSSNNPPLWLWHFHTIKASYAQWDGDYIRAIVHYRQCLLVPGLGDFEYGATLVGLASSQRCAFLGDSTLEEIMHRSIKNGALGLILNRRVGEHDGMPGVLHNQALTLLYALLYKLLPLERIDEVLLLAKEGLSMVEAANSVKHRAILTAEILLATLLAKQDTTPWRKKLQAYGPKAEDSEKEQILSLHTLCVRQFGRGFLEEFWGEEKKSSRILTSTGS